MYYMYCRCISICIYLLIFSCIFLGAVNEKSNKKEEVQTRITNIFHVFLP